MVMYEERLLQPKKMRLSKRLDMMDNEVVSLFGFDVTDSEEADRLVAHPGYLKGYS